MCDAKEWNKDGKPLNLNCLRINVKPLVAKVHANSPIGSNDYVLTISPGSTSSKHSSIFQFWCSARLSNTLRYLVVDIYREAGTGNERDNRILQALSGSIRHGHTHTSNLGNFNLSEANFIAHTFIEGDNSTKGHFFQLHRRFFIIRRSGIGNSVEKQSDAFMLRLRLHQRKSLIGNLLILARVRTSNYTSIAFNLANKTVLKHLTNGRRLKFQRLDVSA